MWRCKAYFVSGGVLTTAAQYPLQSTFCASSISESCMKFKHAEGTQFRSAAILSPTRPFDRFSPAHGYFRVDGMRRSTSIAER
jgi:hypothetical protein